MSEPKYTALAADIAAVLNRYSVEISALPDLIEACRALIDSLEYLRENASVAGGWDKEATEAVGAGHAALRKAGVEP